MIPTCAVTCTMYDQNGSPEEGAVVRAKLNRYEVYEGYVVPEMVTGICDQFGQCTLNLWPNELGATSSLYEITLVGEKGRKLQTQAVVPHVPAADLHTIAIIPPYPGKPDGQITLEEAHKAATEAKAAAEAAKKSEENAKVSEDNAKISEDNAKVSADAAKVSEDNAKASEIAAKASEDAAEDSEENAGKSKEWADKAAISAAEAAVSADEAEVSADASEQSAVDANQSALDAQIAEDSAITAANNSEEAMIKAEEARDKSEDWRDESEWFANNAIWSGPDAPVNPKQLWYRTSGAGAGSTYFYFKDGNSDQWVPMSPAGGGGSGGIGGLDGYTPRPFPKGDDAWMIYNDYQQKWAVATTDLIQTNPDAIRQGFEVSDEDAAELTDQLKVNRYLLNRIEDGQVDLEKLGLFFEGNQITLKDFKGAAVSLPVRGINGITVSEDPIGGSQIMVISGDGELDQRVTDGADKITEIQGIISDALGEQASIKNELEELQIQKGAELSYLLSATSMPTTPRPGQLVVSSPFAQDVSYMGFGNVDQNDVLTKSMQVGDILELIGPGGQDTRFKVLVNDLAPTFLEVEFISGPQSFQEVAYAAYIYPQNVAAASKIYVDAQDALKLNLSGGELTGVVTSNSIIKSHRPDGYAFEVKPSGAATTSFIHTDGSSKFTGQMVLEIPASDTDAEGFLIKGTNTDGVQDSLLSTFHNSGDEPDAVNYHGEIVNPENLVNKEYVDFQIGDAAYLKLDGGTMEGDITLSLEGTEDDHVVTKKYVDDADTVLRNSVVELHEELESIAPTIEGGSWYFKDSGNPTTEPEDGTYFLIDEKSTIVGATDPKITKEFGLTDAIVFANVDDKGVTHTWTTVDVGQHIDLFDADDDDYLLGIITSINVGEKSTRLDVDVISSLGEDEDTEVRIKVFSVDANVDGTSFLKKTGGTMSGMLTIDRERGETAHNSFMIKGRINGSEGATLLKDYQRDAKSTKDDYIEYYGGSPSPNAIVNKGYVVKLNDETRDYADSQPIPRMVLWKCVKNKTKTTLGSNEFMLSETGDAQMTVYMSALSNGRYWAASSSTNYKHGVGDHICTITNQYGSCMRQFKGWTWWFMQGSGSIQSGVGFYNSIQGDFVKNGSNAYKDFVDGEWYNLNFGSPFPLYTYPSAMLKDGNSFK